MPSVHGGAIVASVIPPAPLGTDAAAGRPLGLGADGAPPARARSRADEGVGPEPAAAERRFRFELAAHPGSPAQARRLTLARLTGWAVCADTCDSAALVVTELVTNAIVHTASSRVVCELHDGEDLVRIAVRDEGCAPGEPHPSPQRPEEEHGRGLLLVDALCHAWGAHEHGPGLLVWAELPRKGDIPRESSDPRNDLGWGARPKPGPSGSPGSAAAPQAHAGADVSVDMPADVEKRHGIAPETGGTAGTRQHGTEAEWA
ncbi:ATP-binding protein [Streptomyces sp. NBC_01231]|nr:ATP-binding protein [Streptomyces sp. NBC_01231]